MTAPSPTPREMILLVDDDAPIRKLILRTLETRGYRLLEARNGAEAVRVATQHHEPIHLLLADVVMPYMSGFVVADRVVVSHPETKVLYVSGHAGDSVVVRGGLEESGRPFLLKPFTQSELAEKIRTVLGAPEPATE